MIDLTRWLPEARQLALLAITPMLHEGRVKFAQRALARAYLRGQIDRLAEGRKNMHKRVWVRDRPVAGKDMYQEMPDGAVPCWWIDRCIKELRAELAALEGDDA